MEGQSQPSCLTQIFDLYKQHISEGGGGKISVIVGASGNRRVELVLDLKGAPFVPAAEPARIFTAYRTGNQPKSPRRNKPPSKRRRDRERKEAWIRKKVSCDKISLDAPDAISGETSSMPSGELQLPGETSDTPDVLPGVPGVMSAGEQQLLPGEVIGTGAQSGAPDGFSGREGDHTIPCGEVKENGENEGPFSAPDRRPGEDEEDEYSFSDLEEKMGNKMPYWCTSQNTIFVNFSKVLDERTGVKCTLHPDSYRVLTLRNRLCYSCSKCYGETQFQRLYDFYYVVHKDIKFTNGKIMSIVLAKSTKSL